MGGKGEGCCVEDEDEEDEDDGEGGDGDEQKSRSLKKLAASMDRKWLVWTSRYTMAA